MRRAVSLFLAVAAPAIACRTATEHPDQQASTAAAEAEPVATEVVQEVLANMDRQASPCDDFFRYACGGWIDSNELPPDQSRYGRFNALRERNVEILRNILDAAAKEATADTDRGRIGRFYASCMDEAAVEQQGIEPLEGVLARIDTVKDAGTLMTVAGELSRQGVSPLFRYGVSPDYKQPDVYIAELAQGGLGLPDRQYYLADDEQHAKLREAYVGHITQMLGYLGIPKPERAARNILAFETRLAEASWRRDEMRDPERRYNKLERDALQALTPGLSWDAFFTGAGRADVDAVNVAPPAFFQGLAQTVAETRPEVLRNYLKWQLVHAYADVLPQRFVDADFAFFKKQLEGQQAPRPRWKRCVALVDGALGELLGKEYVDQHFAGESRDVALTMIEGIEHAFANGLEKLPWMDAETRKRALDKMHALVNKIGYPETWRDYAGLEVGDALFANAVAAQIHEHDRELARIGEKVDRKEWHMTPPTVNAYYNPLGNEMVFPAGILQPPFFSPNYPMAMNFGGIGMVMGHELTHGFDDQGRKFDGQGFMRQWWNDEAVARFEEQAACVENLYGSYEVQPGVNLNGKLTLGENIADFGGIKESYRAYENWAQEQGLDPDAVAFDGITHRQLFFLSFGQIWCTEATPEIERVLAVTDPHAHPRYRVNGPLSNLPEFWQTFSCSEGMPMHPENTCEVW